MRRRAIGGYLGAATAIGIGLGGGFSLHWLHVDGKLRFDVELSPIALALWPAAVIAVVVSWRLPSFRNGVAARWPRVLMAFFLDMALYLSVCAIPLCWLALWVEATQAGGFAWNFAREFSRPTDGLVVTLGMALVVLLWWAAPGIALWAGRESPGGLLTGVTLRVREDVTFWRCAAYGLFRYFDLAIPIIPWRATDLGGFEVRAIKTS